MMVALKIAHVAFAAAWFGHKLLIPGDIKESVHSVDGAALFVRRIERAERLGIASGLLTIASGLGLIYFGTGFAEAPLRIYLGLAATIAMVVIGATMARPAWKTIRMGLLDGDAAGASAGEPALRRSLTLENLLWLAALGAMVSS